MSTKADLGSRTKRRRARVLRNGATGHMDIDDCDVPELIGALADRFSGYDIGPREAKSITIEMLAHAFAEQADFDEVSLVDTNPWRLPETVH